MFYQSIKAQSVDYISRMVFYSRKFHQAILPILGIEVEGEPYKDEGAHPAEADAEPLRHATHVENDKHNEICNQATGEDE